VISSVKAHQHLIPRLHLRRFAHGDRLVVYLPKLDLLIQRPQSVANSGVETHTYSVTVAGKRTDALETALAEGIDAAPLNEAHCVWIRVMAAATRDSRSRPRTRRTLPYGFYSWLSQLRRDGLPRIGIAHGLVQSFGMSRPRIHSPRLMALKLFNGLRPRALI